MVYADDPLTVNPCGCMFILKIIDKGWVMLIVLPLFFCSRMRATPGSHFNFKTAGSHVMNITEIEYDELMPRK